LDCTLLLSAAWLACVLHGLLACCLLLLAAACCVLLLRAAAAARSCEKLQI
jgi:hypothetical protein